MLNQTGESYARVRRENKKFYADHAEANRLVSDESSLLITKRRDTGTEPISA